MSIESLPTRGPLSWLNVAVASAGIAVVLWACATDATNLIHMHPAYPVLLIITGVLCIVALWRNLLPRSRRRGWRRAARVVMLVLGFAGIAAIAWLRPYPAVEPALTAMRSDATVHVIETATSITLSPRGRASAVGVFFQPGALVDARAYAAVLRPLAQAGDTVVIAKQPLNIAFLALGAFDDARYSYPEIGRWVVAGHSLGGTVAAIEAEQGQNQGSHPVVGLMFYASYPASSMRTSLIIPVESISGTRDGLATPAKIAASRADLPLDARFTVIVGASHAQFGSYGPQPGDGTPTIDDDMAREQITAASMRFVAEAAGRGSTR